MLQLRLLVQSLRGDHFDYRTLADNQAVLTLPPKQIAPNCRFDHQYLDLGGHRDSESHRHLLFPVMHLGSCVVYVWWRTPTLLSHRTTLEFLHTSKTAKLRNRIIGEIVPFLKRDGSLRWISCRLSQRPRLRSVEDASHETKGR